MNSNFSTLRNAQQTVQKLQLVQICFYLKHYPVYISKYDVSETGFYYVSLSSGFTWNARQQIH
jgi:hypothetical protein